MRLVMMAALLAAMAACNRGAETNNVVVAPAQEVNVAANMQAQAPAQPEASWQTTPSGLRYRRISGSGRGPRPQPTDVVTLHYIGKLENGTVFDSSFNSGAPVTMALPELIPGWQEGVPLMSIGDVFEFEVPPALGYGPSGAGPIPPNATLLFTIGLIRIGA